VWQADEQPDDDLNAKSELLLKQMQVEYNSDTVVIDRRSSVITVYSDDEDE